MSWLKIDDAFEDNPKVLPLSDAAHRLWFKVACWSCKPANLHTQGFVPLSILNEIGSKFSKKKLATLSQELVDAKAGGTKAFGLWEVVDGGFQIHDWDEYRPKEEKMTRSESASNAGKKSAEARKKKNGTAQPKRPNESESFENRSEVGSTERRSESGSTNEVRTSRTPDPVPDPVPDPSPSLEERAVQLLKAQPFEKSFHKPQTWPEVHEVAALFCKELGWKVPKFVNYSNEAARMGELFAEFSWEELELAASRAPGDEWLTSGGKSLHCIDITKVRSLLNTGSNVSPARAGQPDYEGEEKNSFDKYEDAS